jgi:hypothetical protein
VRRTLLLPGLLALAGCQPLPVQHDAGGQHSTSDPVPVDVRADDAVYWLEEWHRTRMLPDDQVLTILRTREMEFEQRPVPRTRLRLSLLLAEGPAVVRDQARASRLLEKLDPERASESAKALAALLQQVIAEQQWSGDKLATQRASLREARARIGELERQLQELTDIEQNLQKRD